MSKKSFIDSVKVGEACNEDWEKMDGNDRFRFCSHCSKNVNNLSEMTRKEAARFVRASDGNICIRYIVDPRSQRPMFANQLHQITRRAPGLTAGVMTASMALSTAAYAQTSPLPVSTPVVVSSTVKGNDATSLGNVITPRVIQDLPIPETVTMAMGGAIAYVEYSSPLSRAVADEDVDAVRDLISKGEKVNGKEEGYSKITPLFVAVEQGNIEIVQMLLDAGAKVNARDKQKQTPLMRIDGDATPELIAVLIRSGAKAGLTDNEGNTALILSAYYTPADTLQALIDAGADINHANNEGYTALMRAAENGSVETVKMLLEAGAQVNAVNEDGDNAWDLTSNDEVKELLATYGSRVKVQDEEKPSLSTIIQ
ncbi:MAG TPA: ankyrin repeat domain-containing protein [Pyrinomonadaceae bacterium]|nr:ankyrin repeat domain-containing protein [Pyrinomonadaceae bacterium]